MKDGLKKIRWIWIGTKKPNHLKCEEDKKRAKTIVMATSVMQVWPKLKEIEVTLESLYKMTSSSMHRMKMSHPTKPFYRCARTLRTGSYGIVGE